jgi:hypothetical protein
VSNQAGEVLSKRTVARGACFADYDDSGKVSGFVVNLGAKGMLVRNVSADTGHWVAIKPVGAMRAGDPSQTVGTSSAKSNRDGIGARVEVYAGDKRWTAERVAGSGYLSQDDSRMHFGIGQATAIDKIVVQWPGGREQTLEKQGVDRVLTVEEPK